YRRRWFLRSQHELRAAATDVQHEIRRLAIQSEGGAQERQRRLLLTARDLHRLTGRAEHRPGQLVAIRRVANRARRHQVDALGPERAGAAAVPLEYRERPAERLRRDPPGAV